MFYELHVFLRCLLSLPWPFDGKRFQRDSGPGFNGEYSVLLHLWFEWSLLPWSPSYKKCLAKGFMKYLNTSGKQLSIIRAKLSPDIPSVYSLHLTNPRLHDIVTRDFVCFTSSFVPCPYTQCLVVCSVTSIHKQLEPLLHPWGWFCMWGQYHQSGS